MLHHALPPDVHTIFCIMLQCCWHLASYCCTGSVSEDSLPLQVMAPCMAPETAVPCSLSRDNLSTCLQAVRCCRPLVLPSVAHGGSATHGLAPQLRTCFAFRSEPDSPTSGPSSPSTPAHFSLRSPAMTAFADSGTSTPDGEDQPAQVHTCADCSCQRPACKAIIVAFSKMRDAVPTSGQHEGRC